jgi:hypothetical protein
MKRTFNPFFAAINVKAAISSSAIAADRVWTASNAPNTVWTAANIRDAPSACIGSIATTRTIRREYPPETTRNFEVCGSVGIPATI